MSKKTGQSYWFARAAKEHRDAWLIGERGEAHAAIAIAKCEDTDVIPGLAGRILKICTFKVAPFANGNKFGELLLKAIFSYAAANAYDGLFVTVYPQHVQLTQLFEQFGFVHVQSRRNGELVLAKELRPGPHHDTLDALAFHIKLGPRAIRSFAEQPTFIVPIRPAFHDALFPEASPQPHLAISGPKPFGCAIRKAYLCNANIRKMRPGDILLFYRSCDQYVICAGVLEGTRVSAQAAEIAKFVGARTVYSFAEIESMGRRRAVLALLFRHARTLAQPIPLDELRANNVLSAPPQTIVSVKEPGRQWLQTAMSREV